MITVLFGLLSRCNSMTEIYEGLRALGGKLNHLGLEKAPAKSIDSEGMRNRDSKFFEDVYFSVPLSTFFVGQPDKQIGFFVPRIKKNARYTVVELLQEHQKQKDKAMVLWEETIEIEYCPEDENGKKKPKKRRPFV